MAPRKSPARPKRGAGPGARSPKKVKRQPKQHEDRGVRLQKFLAEAGVGSRRHCESLMVEGRVQVDLEVITELGTRVKPEEQEIRVDGEVLHVRQHVYYALNKPSGVVCTNKDPEGRPRAIDLIPSQERLFTVGRLDRSSEGLIIVTNDGELANRLTHPRFQVVKRYRVRVAGQPSADDLKQLREGVYLADGFAKIDSIRLHRRHARHTELDMELSEGRNREIRRILARTGHKVLRLTRLSIGSLPLGELPSGACRPLTPREIRELRRLSESVSPTPAKSKRKAPRRPGGSSRSSTSSSANSSASARPSRTGQRKQAQPKRSKRLPETGQRQGAVLILEGDENSATTTTTPQRKKPQKPQKKGPAGKARTERGGKGAARGSTSRTPRKSKRSGPRKQGRPR